MSHFLAAIGDHHVLDEIGRDGIACGGAEESGVHGMRDDRIYGNQVALLDPVGEPDSRVADVVHLIRIRSV
jgi:hypothetical protein